MGNGDIEIYATGNGFYRQAPIGVVGGGVDQSRYSDSNSEVSESVGNSRANLFISGDNENSNEKNNMPFIDFLGVGASWDSGFPG